MQGGCIFRLCVFQFYIKIISGAIQPITFTARPPPQAKPKTRPRRTRPRSSRLLLPDNQVT